MSAVAGLPARYRHLRLLRNSASVSSAAGHASSAFSLSQKSWHQKPECARTQAISTGRSHARDFKYLQDSARCMVNTCHTCSCVSADKDGRAVMRLFETSRIFNAVSVSKPCNHKSVMLRI
jgi:hypothetical protein